MNVNAPIALVAASYSTSDGAVQDFEAVWRTREEGGFHHTSIAVLSRDVDGRSRSGGTTAPPSTSSGWCAARRRPLVLAPAAGVEVLTAVGLSGAGAIVGHFRLNADPDELDTAARLLERGTSALLVVLVNRRGDSIAPLLGHADHSSSVDMVWGDLEEELAVDFSRRRTSPALIAS